MMILRFLTLALLVQIPTQQVPPAAIRGTILQAGSGNPLSNALVELKHTDGTSSRLYSVVSATDGSFLLNGIRPGEYRLSAAHEGYLPSEYGSRRLGSSGVPFNIAPGQNMGDIQIQLSPAASISGRITDRDGDPLGLATVQILTASYKGGKRVLRAVQATSTNDLGEYRLFGLIPGSYYVTVTPPVENSQVNNSALSTISAVNDLQLLSRLFNFARSLNSAAFYYPGTLDSRAASVIDLMAGSNIDGVNIVIAPATDAPRARHDPRWGSPSVADVDGPPSSSMMFLKRRNLSQVHLISAGFFPDHTSFLPDRET